MTKPDRTYDAIVIGSGISGGWAAKELCDHGLKTLVLERGRDVQHIKDYPTANMAPWELPHRGYNPRKLIDENPSREGSRTVKQTNKWRNLFLKSALALLSALVSLISPARAQSPLLDSGLLNLGLAFPTGTSGHIVLAMGGTCAATHTGACGDVEIGFEGRSGFINLANIGYSVAFGPERSTSLFPRVGITAVGINEHVANSFFVGYDAAVGLRHEFKSHLAGSVDYTWRHYPGFVWPMVTVGLEGH